ENRVHAHATPALINICKGVERDTPISYLDPILERYLKLCSLARLSEVRMGRAGGVDAHEQMIRTLVIVADASENTFAKVNFLPFLVSLGCFGLGLVLTLAWFTLFCGVW
ncbi:uncharacterized protein STEHIDRAFT_64995, partial [Stereum hirsutum FP-91666 SS1]|uniref:uncharacterized protein n=1 Tax=Stereum hirsutum (strain FP-91666) TaxID=721885 RepID=UPI000444A71C